MFVCSEILQATTKISFFLEFWRIWRSWIGSTESWSSHLWRPLDSWQQARPHLHHHRIFPNHHFKSCSQVVSTGFVWIVSILAGRLKLTLLTFKLHTRSLYSCGLFLRSSTITVTVTIIRWFPPPSQSSCTCAQASQSWRPRPGLPVEHPVWREKALWSDIALLWDMLQMWIYHHRRVYHDHFHFSPPQQGNLPEIALKFLDT